MELNDNSRIGRIYKIVGYGLTYYGSTIQLLSDRKSTHVSQYKEWVIRGEDSWKCASYDILKQGDEWEMVLLETVLTDKEKVGLLEQEQKWITENECVNKNQAIQSTEDLKKYKREWAQKNRREKGTDPKNPDFDAKKYARQWAKAKRAEMTDEERVEFNKNRKAKRNNEQRQVKRDSMPDEERAEFNKKRRETRPEQTEEQKKAAVERARKQREDRKADPEQVIKNREYQKVKAQQKRDKMKSSV